MSSQGGGYVGGIGSRREAREQALALLYEAEVKGAPVAEVIEAQVVPPDPYTVALVVGVFEHRGELDASIDAHSRNWRLDRMPTLDLLLLRLGAEELLHHLALPVGGGLQRAKTYSTDESGRFVNGVLNALGSGVAEDDGAR